jgi:serine/threonine-protein kinase RsbW
LKVNISNRPEQYAKALAALEEFCHQHRLSEDNRRCLQVLLEESVTNVIKYAYPKGIEGSIEISFNADRQWLSITVVDRGEAFNPLLEDFDDESTFGERMAGGMGIVLIKELTDKVNYNYVDDCNRLEMWVRII